MVLVSQIITEAYRESNNIPIGDTPNVNEQQEGLLLFNRLLRSVIGTDVGDAFVPYAVGTNGIDTSTSPYPSNFPTVWYPPVNSRIICNLTSPQSFFLNPSPQDGERFAINDASNNFATYPVTMKGNGRTINGLAQVVLNTNGLDQEYMYRADLADWRIVNDLTLVDSLPFPEEFEDLFIIGLALRINPRNGTQIDPQSIQEYKRLKVLFKARYAVISKQDSEEGLLRTSGIRLRPRTLTGFNRFTTGY